ncbi:MAG: ABC-type transport auxiliary lipoprotein family protein [Pseudomonadota bacterium]
MSFIRPLPRLLPARCVLGLFVLGLLAGCANPLERPQAPTSYRIAPDLTIQPAAGAPHPYTLQVTRMQAAPGLNSERIAYRRSTYRLDYYTQSRWASPPADMLVDQLARALEDAGLYRVVLGPETRLPADLRLITELTALEHVIKDSSASQGSEIRLGLRVKLVDAASARVLASGSVEAVRPAFSQDAQGAVTAFNEAARDAIEQVIGFCAENTPVQEGTPVTD